jgi:hypothetical protein
MIDLKNITLKEKIDLFKIFTKKFLVKVLKEILNLLTLMNLKLDFLKCMVVLELSMKKQD